MRVHAIHVQGLRQPPGVHRLTLEGGYPLLVVPDAADAAGLRRTIEGLLYPDSALGSLEALIDPVSEVAPRAGLSLTLGVDSLRVIADLAAGRIHLGRYEAGAGAYERISTEPAEIRAILAKAGIPECEVLFGERSLGWGEEPPPQAEGSDPGAEATARQRAQLLDDLERAESDRSGLEELEARASQLRAARERLVEAEREAKRGRSDLERHALAAERFDGLEIRVRHYRALAAARDREHEAIGSARLELLDQRAHLKRVPATQRPWMALGVALGAAGAVAAELFQPWLAAFALVGVGVALTALGISESAQRRMRGLDKRGAALRAREREVERDFESEGRDIRALLESLDLESPEELLAETERQRQLQQRGEQLNAELEEAQRAFPEQAEAELSELETRLATLRDGPTPDAIRERLASLEPAAVERAIGPRPLDVEGAAERSGVTVERLHDLLAPVLPLYLRTLSGGFLREARHEPAEGWRLRDENGAEVGLEGLPPIVGLAFRFALVEALARIETASLFVGPGLDELDERSSEAVARAFRRLGSMVQVVQVSRNQVPWASCATGVASLAAAT
jgi:hypothetical protein